MILRSCASGARHLLASLVCIAAATTGAAQAPAAAGSVTGRVVNAETGLGVANATVAIASLGVQATSDLGGAYALPGVPAGSHEVTVSKEGMQTANVTGVQVAAGEPARLDLPLVPAAAGDTIKMEAFTVAAAVVQGSDLGLLAARQKAVAVSDAIGGEQFGRLAVSDAAEALSKVTGASVVDGKYVFIRGLGDRYANTLMNGVAVPTADPDKRAVQMDQFPADLLDSIVTTKSFTPDQPGAFSGGSVNIRTKSFPEHFFVSLGGALEYNDQVTGEDILTVPGGDGDEWALGADDRKAPVVPQAIPDRNAATIAARQGNFTPAEQLEAATRAFDTRSYFPTTESAGPDLGFSIALGDRLTWGGGEKMFGYTASLTYDRETDHFTDGVKNRYEGILTAPQARLALTPDRAALTFGEAALPAGTPPLGVTSSTRTVSWGAFTKLALKPSAHHEFSLDVFHNQSADDTVQRGVGEQARDYAGNLYEVYDLLYTQRGVTSLQWAGKSLFPSAGEWQLDHRVAYSRSTQDQPDYRTLAAYYDLSGAAVNATGVQPNRFFRELSEDSREAAVDVSRPFAFRDREARFKAGLSWLQGERDYSEQRFQWSNRPQSRADLDQFPGPVGIVARTGDAVSFGNTITRLQEPNNYTAEQTLSAGYAMVDLPATAKLRAIAGVRFEKTEMETAPVRIAGINPRDGVIDQTDALPALNLVYAPNARTNWRAAYGRTLARPTFKELTDIRYEDVFTLDTYLGNPDLELTTIDNLDLRWEWFPRRGETVAVSAFYKQLKNPIEVVFETSVGSIQPQNVEEGKVYGVEFEFRRGLGAYFAALEPLSFGANLTFVSSEVTIPATELANIRAIDPGADGKRDLLGQSPYVFNADLTYDRRSSGTVATVSFNVVGERLSLVQFGSLPDVYEQPAPALNLVLSQRLGERLRLKFSAKNLLDADREKLIGFGDYDLVYERYRTGRSFSVSLTWMFE